MTDDLRDVVALVRAARPGVPVIVVGESMGGAVALAGLAEVYKRKHDAKGERAARSAYARAWAGPAAGPDLAKL